MIIGFSAGMGAGKTTAIECVQFLLKDTKQKIAVVKFAQPLYDMQEFIYRRISSVHERPADFVKDRKLLQWLGTDWGRDSINQNLWVNIWKAEALAKQKEGYLVLCDDVRFDNEAVELIKLDGIVVKINADFAKERITTANGLKNHASEAGISLEYVTHTVDNNGTKSEYQDKLIKLFSKILDLNTEAK